MMEDMCALAAVVQSSIDVSAATARRPKGSPQLKSVLCSMT